MAGELDYVYAGQKANGALTAASWNAFIDAARAVRAGKNWTNGDPADWGETRYVAKNITPIYPGGMTCPTAYLFDVYVPDPDSVAEHPPLIPSTDPGLLSLVGINRHDIEEDPGCNLRMEWLNGEWGAYDIQQDGSCDSHSSSSSSSSASQSQSGSSSVSGSGSSSGSCGSVTVVTGVSCSSGGLNVTYGSAKANC